MTSRIFMLLVCAVLAPAATIAQDTPPSQTSQGPMTVERISNEWVVAPEYKVTDIHGEVGQLVGASGGRLIDRVLLIGAAGYWMVDASRGTDMGYGGVILEWRQRADHLIGVGLRGLAGFGQATRRLSVTVPVRSNGRDGDNDLFDGRFRFRQDFFIFEPEADLVVNFTQRLCVRAGAGYRLTSSNTRGVSSLNGATGTVAFQIGW